ncbi:MAG: uracil-DNA glycosylase [Pyrinomonadaceae bacterium]
MTDELQLKRTLAQIAEEVAEIADYARELGIEAVEGTLPATKPAVQTSVAPPALLGALERNARSVTAADTNLPAPPASKFAEATARAPFTKDATQDSLTPMATQKTKKYPDADPPAPQDTLFGEVTPQDDESLPRPDETLENIRNDIGECMRCPLCCQGRSTVVHSEGNREARLMFVGEAPGADEDASGRPFVGRAGQLLNKIIEAISMKREDIFIGNVNRCRPPQNRTPTLAEAKICKPFLLREVAVVKPDVIVVLGNTAMKNLLDTKEGITKLRGQFQDYRGIKVMPTFHPAYLLRDPTKKRETWDDMKKVRDYLSGKAK